MLLIDTHCHIYSEEFENDRKQVILGKGLTCRGSGLGAAFVSGADWRMDRWSFWQGAFMANKASSYHAWAWVQLPCDLCP